MLLTDTPGAPGTPKIVETKRGAVTLKWTPPSDDGGSPLTSYVIEYRPEGAFRWVLASDDIVNARYEVTGLEEGTKYDFRVAAKNKMGVGKYAECASSVEAKEPIGELNHSKYLHINPLDDQVFSSIIFHCSG